MPRTHFLPRDRAVKFALPRIKSAADIARAMEAVAAALADGLITPAEGQAIARVVTTFVQTIEASEFDRRLQLLEADQTPLPAEKLPLQTRCRSSGAILWQTSTSS